MVKLRLRRAGKKKHPIYKVVAADIRSPRDGRYIEAVGQYDPNAHPIALSLKDERIFHWLRKGAQPTDTVHNFLVKAGVVSGAKVPVHKKPKAKEGAAAPQEAAPPAAAAASAAEPRA